MDLNNCVIYSDGNKTPTLKTKTKNKTPKNCLKTVLRQDTVSRLNITGYLGHVKMMMTMMMMIMMNKKQLTNHTAFSAQKHEHAVRF